MLVLSVLPWLHRAKPKEQPKQRTLPNCYICHKNAIKASQQKQQIMSAGFFFVFREKVCRPCPMDKAEYHLHLFQVIYGFTDLQLYRLASVKGLHYCRAKGMNEYIAFLAE